MPIHVYECSRCGYLHEEISGAGAHNPETLRCPACSAAARRLVGCPAIVQIIGGVEGYDVHMDRSGPVKITSAAQRKREAERRGLVIDAFNKHDM